MQGVLKYAEEMEPQYEKIEQTALYKEVQNREKSKKKKNIFNV